jgi:hypothetical protein
MKQHAINLDSANLFAHPNTSSFHKSSIRFTIVVISLLTVILSTGCDSHPSTGLWVALILFAIAISALGVRLHRYDMRQHKAAKRKAVENLRAMLIAQEDILAELKEGNTTLLSLVELAGGDIEQIQRVPADHHRHESEVRGLALAQAAMVWELQLTFRLKKALLNALGGGAEYVPDLPPFLVDVKLDLPARELAAQTAIAKTLKFINQLDRRIYGARRLQRLKPNSHQ